MIDHCPLFVELCAGTAAVSLQMHAGQHARPPVSRMGSKRGYAHAILRVLGLRPGQGHADRTRYLWCEPDDGVRLLLHAYTDRALAQKAARIIRGWAGEEPRALWERLRAEGPARCPDAVEAREVARWLYVHGRSHGMGNGSTFAPEHNGRPSGGQDGNAPPRPILASRAADAATLPATIHDDARDIDPREVARWAWVQGHGDASKPPRLAAQYQNPDGNAAGSWKAPPRGWLANRFDASPTLPAAVHPDARDIDPPQLPPGVVAYMDVPYANLSPVVPPMLAAERLPLGRIGSAEGDAALAACGLDGLREPVGHLRVAISEVLRSAGVESEVLGSVVERVVVDVVDDLVWSQWATDEALHHKAVLRDDAAVLASVAVPTLKPPLAAVHAASGGQLLNLGRHLRDFALACKALPGSAPEFADAVAWADGALAAGVRVPPASQLGSANLARDLERHCKLREVVRRDTNTRIARPGGKTTGYAHAFPRPEWLPVARRWDAAGATVCISEAEPIPELVADGWHAVDITSTRKGQRRTFSKQQAEWLTLNRVPAWTPPVQALLFGGVA